METLQEALAKAEARILEELAVSLYNKGWRKTALTEKGKAE